MQPPWLDQAWADLGVREGAGNANDPRVLAYYRDAGHPEIKADSVAWCAAFVGAMLERSGIKSIPLRLLTLNLSEEIKHTELFLSLRFQKKSL